MFTEMLENLDALIVKAQELQKVLVENPDVVEYLRLAERIGDKIIPLPADRLIRVGEAAKVLKVSTATIYKYIEQKKLTVYYTLDSRRKKFWLSEVKKLAVTELSS